MDYANVSGMGRRSFSSGGDDEICCEDTGVDSGALACKARWSGEATRENLWDWYRVKIFKRDVDLSAILRDTR